MDKPKILTPLEDSTTKFTASGEGWEFSTGWGEVTLKSEKTQRVYFFDIRKSSVLNLTLIIFAIKKEKGDVSYELKCGEGEETVALIIMTKIETLTYYFAKKGSANADKFIGDLQALIEKCGGCQGKLPLVGTFKPTKWVEYSVQDIIADFDYSFLKLQKTPLVFTDLVGRPGYTSILRKTKAECSVMIHWTEVETLPIKTEDIVLEYCIFPQETEQAPIEEAKAKKAEETVFDSYAKVRQEVAKGRELVVFEDQVVDVKEFEERHIGTAIPLKGNLGKEVGRYIYGSFDFLGRLNTHTKHAIELMGKYKVGRMVDPPLEGLFEGIDTGYSIRDYEFSLLQQEGVTDLHALAKLNNPQIKLCAPFNDITSFGRYFAVTSADKGVTRNFACAFVGAEKISIEHIKLATKVEQKAPYEVPFEAMDDVRLENVPLVVKGINDYSTWLMQEAPEGSKFVVGGPYGCGLELSPEEKNPVVAITGGTGILFFVDLVAYLMRMNADKIGNQTGNKYKIFADEEFKHLTSPSFKFILFSSFSTSAVPYQTMIRNLDKWGADYNLNNFKAYLRVGEKEKAKWDAAYFRDKIPKNASRIYLAGGKAFLASVSDALAKCDFKPETITYL